MFELTLPFPEEFLDIPREVGVYPREGAVLLPGEPLPLLIPDERHRMAPAFIQGKFLAVSGHKPGSGAPSGVFGLGRIAMDEELADGGLNLVVIGLKRVRVRSYVTEKPFLRAEIEVLEDTFSQTAANLISSLSKEVYALGRELLEYKKQEPKEISFPDLENMPCDQLPLGTLCDLFSAAVSLPSLEKRMILEELDAVRRAEKLIFILRFELEARRMGQTSRTLQ